MSGKNKKIDEKNSVLFTLKILNTSILNVSNNKFFVVDSCTQRTFIILR